MVPLEFLDESQRIVWRYDAMGALVQSVSVSMGRSVTSVTFCNCNTSDFGVDADTRSAAAGIIPRTVGFSTRVRSGVGVFLYWDHRPQWLKYASGA